MSRALFFIYFTIRLRDNPPLRDNLLTTLSNSILFYQEVKYVLIEVEDLSTLEESPAKQLEMLLLGLGSKEKISSHVNTYTLNALFKSESTTQDPFPISTLSLDADVLKNLLSEKSYDKAYIFYNKDWAAHAFSLRAELLEGLRCSMALFECTEQLFWQEQSPLTQEWGTGRDESHQPMVPTSSFNCESSAFWETPSPISHSTAYESFSPHVDNSRLIVSSVVKVQNFDLRLEPIINSFKQIITSRRNSHTLTYIQQLAQFVSFYYYKIKPFLTDADPLNPALFISSIYQFFRQMSCVPELKESLYKMLNIMIIPNTQEEQSLSDILAPQSAQTHSGSTRIKPWWDESIFLRALGVRYKEPIVVHYLNAYENSCYRDPSKKITRTDFWATLSGNSGAGGYDKLRQFNHYLLIAQQSIYQEFAQSYREYLNANQAHSAMRQNLETEEHYFTLRIHLFMLLFYIKDNNSTGHFAKTLRKAVLAMECSVTPHQDNEATQNAKVETTARSWGYVFATLGPLPDEYLYKQLEQEYEAMFSFLKPRLMARLNGLLTNLYKGTAFSNEFPRVAQYESLYKQVLELKYFFFGGAVLGLSEKLTIVVPDNSSFLGDQEFNTTPRSHLAYWEQVIAEYLKRLKDEASLAQASVSDQNPVAVERVQQKIVPYVT